MNKPNSSQYTITQQADLFSGYALTRRFVSESYDLYQATKLSDFMANKKDREKALAKEVPLYVFMMLLKAVSNKLLQAVKQKYPNLKPNERIVIDGFRTHVIPLPKMSDVEMIGGGTILHVKNPNQTQTGNDENHA